MNRTLNQQRTRLLAAMVVPALLAALAIAAFAWAAARIAPRDLPLGVAGPRAAAVAGQLAARAPGAFAVHYYAGDAQARAAVRHRDVYGAVVTTPRGVRVLTASAASPLVAKLLAGAAAPQASPIAGPPAAQASSVRVVDVVPASAKDPRGIAFGASLLPLVLIGSLTGVITLAAVRAGPWRITALLAASALVGLGAAGIMQGWLGVIPGNWAANGAVLGLIVLAISAAVSGLGGLFGYPGLALGALLMVFVGNPFSAVTSAPEMMPVPVGTIGQLMPAGAGQNLLRSTAFFGGYGAGGHLAVLLIWAAAGLTAIWAGSLRQQRHAQAGTIAPTTATANHRPLGNLWPSRTS